MIFLFEDKESDLLSKLFAYAYDSCSFVYICGNGNLVSYVENLLISSSEYIVVYLDTIPDNKATVNIYNMLRQLSIRNNYRVLVLPIVCAEYYFILSLPDSGFISTDGLDICKNREYWAESLLVSDTDRAFTKNFEKYCKLVLIKDVKDCVRHSRKDNPLYGVYYTQKCLCYAGDNTCEELRLDQKAISYVQQYPLIPRKGFKGTYNQLEDFEIWDIQRRLVDEFNAMVDRYARVDKERAYSKIKYIK